MRRIPEKNRKGRRDRLAQEKENIKTENAEEQKEETTAEKAAEVIEQHIIGGNVVTKYTINSAM